MLTPTITQPNARTYGSDEEHGNRKVSVVIPVYNAEATLVAVVEQIVERLAALSRALEIILVDDASEDSSWLVARQLRDRFPAQVKIVRLHKNSGQHNALLCGFTFVTGSIVITMDDDLQHNPYDFPKLIRKIEEGYDLAIGSYATEQTTFVRKLFGDLIDRTQCRIFDLPKTFQLTSLRAIDRSVVDRALEMTSVYPYITSMLLSHSSSPVNVAVTHHSRANGKSNYNFWKSASLALNLVLSYTSYPLCAIALLLVSAIAVALFTLIVAMTHNSVLSTWTAIAFISCFSATILFSQFLICLYLVRLYRCQTGITKPFVVREYDA
jgi:polyisoprenyl-phosphate glycosyltransferase